LSSFNIPSFIDEREAFRLATDDSVLLSLLLIEERTEKTIEKLIIELLIIIFTKHITSLKKNKNIKSLNHF
jgi:hypothetical protein